MENLTDLVKSEYLVLMLQVLVAFVTFSFIVYIERLISDMRKDIGKLELLVNTHGIQVNRQTEADTQTQGKQNRNSDTAKESPSSNQSEATSETTVTHNKKDATKLIPTMPKIGRVLSEEKQITASVPAKRKLSDAQELKELAPETRTNFRKRTNEPTNEESNATKSNIATKQSELTPATSNTNKPTKQKAKVGDTSKKVRVRNNDEQANTNTSMA